LAAIFLSELMLSFGQGISEQKAAELAAVGAGFVESLLSPLFWVLAVFFFALLFSASRLGNKLLRIVLFWIPAVLVASLGIAFVTLLTYVLIRFRHR